MPTCHIDHITIVSPTLAAGSELVRTLLGVVPQQGGEHPRMGTHNLLLPLGETMFLEVIAINPDAPPPERPRWFALDRVTSASKPSLGCWVARTEDIASSLEASTEDLGPAEPMTRGTLEWLISIPGDGSLPLGGAAPALIQWKTGIHPASRMQDKGCRLVELKLLHPEPKRLQSLLSSLQFGGSGPVLSIEEASAPALVAYIRTPAGLRILGTPGSASEAREGNEPVGSSPRPQGATN